MSTPAYAAIGIYRPGESKPSLMSFEGNVIVFDTDLQAREFLPLLGEGRVTRWSDKDTAFWLPTLPQRVNRAMVITDYDVYNLPPGLPVLSETHGREWRHHIAWAEWIHTPDPTLRGELIEQGRFEEAQIATLRGE